MNPDLNLAEFATTLNDIHDDAERAKYRAALLGVGTGVVVTLLVQKYRAMKKKSTLR